MTFHDVRFPTEISRGAQGGPERRTDVVVLGSGYEERNARWANSRRSYNAGYGITSLDALHAVIAFFEERRGRLYGFRWRDHADWKSCAPQGVASALDQLIGTGDGMTAAFALKKTYGSTHAPWAREIKKPVAGTVLIAVAGATKTLGVDFTVDLGERDDHVSSGPHPCDGTGGHGRLRVRRAGALRHRQARGQPLGVPARRHPQHPGRRDPHMKQLPAELAAHLATGVTTLCWCWRLTRRDGAEQGFTDHDRDVVFDGTTFEAAAGFTASEIKDAVGLSVDNLEVTSALSSERLAEGDLSAGLYDDAKVEIFRVNWQAPEQRVLMRAGSLGEVKRAGGAFTAEVRGLAHYLQQPKGRLFQYACDADLGDARCGIDLEAPVFRGTGAVLRSRERAPVHGRRARCVCLGMVHAWASDFHVGRGVGAGN